MKKIPARKFTYETSARIIGRCYSEIVDSNGNPKDGWKLIGFCKNSELIRPHCGDPGPGHMWIAMMYEDESGKKVWFHQLINIENYHKYQTAEEYARRTPPHDNSPTEEEFSKSSKHMKGEQ